MKFKLHFGEVIVKINLIKYFNKELNFVVIQKNKDKLLKIKTDWCKGCGICVEFCPKNVLGLKNGKIVINNIEACIKCGLCELRCPDFAIYLGGNDDD